MSLTRFLRVKLRGTDIIGRHGGEEFVTILLDTDRDTALELVTRTLDEFRNVEHGASSPNTSFVTFSAGIAELEAGWSLEQCKVIADGARYEAKNAGRCLVRAANPLPVSRLADAILDSTVLDSLRELGRRSNTNLLSEIFEIFLRVGSTKVALIRQALEEREARALELAAHAFQAREPRRSASRSRPFARFVPRTNDILPRRPGSSWRASRRGPSVKLRGVASLVGR